jgi:hypothetical protein
VHGAARGTQQPAVAHSLSCKTRIPERPRKALVRVQSLRGRQARVRSAIRLVWRATRHWRQSASSHPPARVCRTGACDAPASPPRAAFNTCNSPWPAGPAEDGAPPVSLAAATCPSQQRRLCPSQQPCASGATQPVHRTHAAEPTLARAILVDDDLVRQQAPLLGCKASRDCIRRQCFARVLGCIRMEPIWGAGACLWHARACVDTLNPSFCKSSMWGVAPLEAAARPGPRHRPRDERGPSAASR